MGMTACCDCFMAETTIFSTLSPFSSFLSEKRQSKGEKRSTPNSVAFSANHSILSMFLVGAKAMCKVKSQLFGRGIS